MITIFLPVESTRRELDYKLNLARIFCSKGYKVIFGNSSFIRDELKYKNYQAIFLEKGLNPDPGYYSLLQSKGIYLYDLSDEGAVEPVYSINYQPTIDGLKYMRLIFLWGEAQKADLIKRNTDPLLSKKYTVIGNPAFDLCSHTYKAFHRNLKPTMFPATYILVNTNFGCAQSYDIEEHLQACTLINPLTAETWRRSYIKEEKEFRIFSVWLTNIIESFPAEKFLIRPHPSERLENYVKIFGGYKNVIISKEGNANQAIASAKLVIHKDCSTALQSYLMKVPVISLGGEVLSADYAQWPLAFSLSPKNLDDAKILIQNICLHGQWDEALQLQIDKKAKKILAENFHDVGDSSKELVDFILKDAQQLIKDSFPYKLIDARTPIQKIKVFVRKILPLYYKTPRVVRETFFKITKKDILVRLSFFESVSSLGVKFKVKKVFHGTFELSRE